jgi:hypothetical protein
VIAQTFRQPSPQDLGKVLFQHVDDPIQRWFPYAGAVRLSSSKPLSRDQTRQGTQRCTDPTPRSHLTTERSSSQQGSRDFAGTLGLLRWTGPIAHSLRGPLARNSRPDKLDELNRTRDR